MQCHIRLYQFVERITLFTRVDEERTVAPELVLESPKNGMLHDLLCTIPPSSCVAKLEDSKRFQGRYEYTGEMGSISKISTGKSHVASKMFILKLPRVS